MGISTVQVKKDEGSIDDVLGSYRGQAVDEERLLDAPVREDVGAAFDFYVRYLATMKDLDKATFVLTPREIYALLKATVVEADPIVYSWRTGIYVSKLIQNSYDAGYNNFMLDTHKPDSLAGAYCNIGMHLRAENTRPLRLRVEGDVSAQCAIRAKHLIMHVNGSMHGKDAAKYASSCKIIIQGDIGDECLRGITGSKITVKGKVGKNCGGWGSSWTDFRVYNEEAAAALIKSVPKHVFNGISRNRIILVENNKEIVLRDYGSKN